MYVLSTAFLLFRTQLDHRLFRYSSSPVGNHGSTNQCSKSSWNAKIWALLRSICMVRMTSTPRRSGTTSRRRKRRRSCSWCRNGTLSPSHRLSQLITDLKIPRCRGVCYAAGGNGYDGKNNADSKRNVQHQDAHRRAY